VRAFLHALLVLCFLLTAQVSGAVTGKSFSTRIINFPAKGVGKYYIEGGEKPFLAQWPEIAVRKLAKGRVVVPADASVAVETYWCIGDCIPQFRFMRPADIQSLDVDGSILTHDSFKYISRLTGLRTLTLDGTDADDRDVEFISTRMPSLQSLNLGYTKITDKGLASIAKMRSIRSLSFQKDAITAKGLTHLAQNPALAEIDFNATDINDDALRVLSKMSSLSVLNFAKTKISDKGLSHLRTLPSIRKLDLSGTLVTDAGVRDVLAKLENLEELNLSATKVTDAGVAHLAKLKHLRKLWLRELRAVSDASIPALSGLSGLLDLELQKTNITQRGIQILAKALPQSDVHSKALCKCRTKTRVN
jgi:hypothetical protein